MDPTDQAFPYTVQRSPVFPRTILAPKLQGDPPCRVIRRVGSNITSFKVGDRVMVCRGRRFAN